METSYVLQTSYNSPADHLYINRKDENKTPGRQKRFAYERRSFDLIHSVNFKTIRAKV